MRDKRRWSFTSRSHNHPFTSKFHPVSPLELRWMSNISREYSVCCPKKHHPPVSSLEDLHYYSFFDKTNLPTHQYNYWRVNRACKGEKKLFFYLQVPKSPIYPCLSSQATMDGYHLKMFQMLSEVFLLISIIIGGQQSLRGTKVSFYL